MTIPSVMVLEMAMEALRTRDAAVVAAESRQFHALGPMRLQQIRESVPVPAGLDVQKDAAEIVMLAGYLLGLETARVLAATGGTV
jgi:hypothetical protein